MYDGGNRIRIRSGPSWSSDLSYTNDCSGVADHSAGVGDVKYNTCKLSDGNGGSPLFIATFTSASASITGVQVWGGLGCDGSG